MSVKATQEARTAINFTGVLKRGECINGGFQIPLPLIGRICFGSIYMHSQIGEEKQTLVKAKKELAKDSGVVLGKVYIG